MTWIIQIVVSIALTLVVGLIKQALSSNNKKKEAVGGRRGSVQYGGKVPQSFLVGTIGVAGRLEYPTNTWGTVDGTQNAYRVDIFSLGDLPINALTGIYVFGEKVTKSSTSHVTQGYPIPQYRLSGKNYLWWEFLDGNQTTASSYLTGKFGFDPERPITSQMIWRGVPIVIMTARIHENLWPGEPTYLFEAQGIKLYDPRKDTTAGGSGSHRLNDQSTWEWTDNNAVIIYNIALGIRYNNEIVWGGGYKQAQLPYAVWAAAMDACDVSVARATGGTEKAFRGGREIFFNERPADVMEEFLVGCNGRIAPAGGKLYIHVGAPPTASASFSDDDLIISEAQTLNLFPDLDGAINGATATYLEPSQAWEFKEAPPYSNPDYKEEDGGRQLENALSLDTVFSATQAQRIVKALVKESRRFKQHVVVLSPEFGYYRPLETLSWTSDRNGYSSKLFLITTKTVAPNGNVIFTLYECDPDDYEWDVDEDEQPVEFAPLTPNRPPPQPMTGWSVAPYIHYDAAVVARKAGIEVGFAGGLDDVRAVRVQVRKPGEILSFYDGEHPYDAEVESPAVFIVASAILADQTFEVRGKYVRYSAAQTLWSNQEIEDGDIVDGDWLSVTTPNVSEDLAPGSVTFEHLNAELQNVHGVVVGEGHESIVAALNAIEVKIAEQAAANLTDQATNKVKTTLLRTQVGSAIAAVLNEQQARADGDSALALQISQVLANLDSLLAEGLLQIHAEADPEEATATIALRVRAQTEDTYANAGIYMKAVANGDGTSEGSVLIATDDGENGSHILVGSDSFRIYGKLGS